MTISKCSSKDPLPASNERESSCRSRSPQALLATDSTSVGLCETELVLPLTFCSLGDWGLLVKTADEAELSNENCLSACSDAGDRLEPEAEALLRLFALI